MKKVVIIGGGSGLNRQLRAVKKLKNIKLDVIVTVADDGGSTGKLRSSFNIPAVGDIRNVMSSLADEKHNLQNMLNYRFNEKLENHSLGNMMLTSLIDITGDFNEAIRELSKLLRIKGTIHPLTDDAKTQIHALYNDGSEVVGESKIPNPQKTIEKIFYENEPKANPNAIRVLKEADYIIFGIGSLYTSLIANLCHPKIAAAIKKSSAEIIYFMNLFQEYGETHGMTDLEHIQAIHNHIQADVISYVVLNKTKIPTKLVEKYSEANQPLVPFKKKIESKIKAKIIIDDLAEIDSDKKIRHSVEKMFSILEKIVK